MFKKINKFINKDLVLDEVQYFLNMMVLNIVFKIKYGMNIHRVNSFRILKFFGLILYQVKINILFPTPLYKRAYRIKQKLYMYKDLYWSSHS